MHKPHSRVQLRIMRRPLFDPWHPNQGGGSHTQDGCTLLVVTMDKELKRHHEHGCGFGERQRLAHQPTETLAQRVCPSVPNAPFLPSLCPLDDAAHWG